MNDSWGQWFRSNFVLFLLVFLFMGLMALVLHMAHDAVDKEHVLFAREQAGTVLGALLGLITKESLRRGDQGNVPPEAPKVQQ